jgi:hypothetical protein
MRDELQAVADAERGQAEFEDGGVGGRRVGVVDRAGSSGEDETEGLLGANLFDGCSAGKDDGEDVLLADAARDELGVLRTEVEDDDRGSVHELFYWPSNYEALSAQDRTG